MIASEKIKTIDSKIQQSKTQYNLDRKTAKTLALSSENVGKYEFSTGEYVLSEKKVLEEAATIKNIEFFPLRSELKKQIDIEKKNDIENYTRFKDSIKQYWMKSVRIHIWFIKILISTNSVLLVKSLESFLMTQNISTSKRF